MTGPERDDARPLAATLAAAVLLSIGCVVSTSAAEGPASGNDEYTPAERSHWAFQPIRRPALPEVARRELLRTPIDAFVLAALEKEGLTYSPEAERGRLIRRLKFDLLGLPASRDEVEEFVADPRPDAYERLVERYLASPHYGEAWGRVWLDVVRFADTAGYNADPLRPLAYQYRDYVVRAFNEDIPFDRFVHEQIAGDELFPDDRDALIATGYLRMWPDESNASNILLARQEALNDLTGNLGATFLGLTLACAQCHDHKFDPLHQKDYYSLQAFFAGITPADRAPLGRPEQLADYRRRHGEWLDSTEPLRRELQELEATARIPLTAEKRMKFPKIVLDAIDTPPERRSPMQRQLAFWSERQIDYKEADLLKKLSDEQKTRRDELRRELAEAKQNAPKPPGEVAALTIAESAENVPVTNLLSTGSYDRPEAELKPAFLGVLFPPATGATATTAATPAGSSGRRTALAQWLTSPQNPLTARVFANRVWQEHFGRGLVENANDFGTQTKGPSHPELLDWLASELRGQNQDSANPSPPAPPGGIFTAWSGLKHLHRLIVTSTAYRQSTHRIDDTQTAMGEAADPDNTLYWHYPRRRLSAERVRDALLAASGELNTAMTGPGICPPLPSGYNSREAWTVSIDRRDHARRSVYILAKRNLPFPMLHAFDLPDMHESCARRSTTTTAPQALMLLNSEFVRAAAESLARRILAGASADQPASIVAEAWQDTLGRTADEAETRAAVAFLARQQQLGESERTALSIPDPAYDGPAVAETGRETTESAVADLCHILLNSNEFLYLD